MPSRAGAAAVPGGSRGWAGGAQHGTAAPGGGGSRRGAAPGLRPGKCGGGGRQEEEEEEEGGVGGQRINRVQLPACPNACAYPRRMPVLSQVHSAVEAALSSYLSVRPFHECGPKETVASRRFPPWILRGRKIEDSFSGREKNSSNSFKTKSCMLVTGR